MSHPFPVTESDELESVLTALDPLLRAYSKRIFRQQWEDAFQESRIGVIQAHGRFDPERGKWLLSWCYVRGKGAALDYVRSQVGHATLVNPRPEMLSLDAAPWIGERAHADPGYQAAEDRADLVALAAVCTPHQRHTLALMLLGLNGAEIAAARGTTDSTTTQALGKVREKAYRLGLRERPANAWGRRDDDRRPAGAR